MKSKRFCFIIVLCIIVLSLSACSNKPNLQNSSFEDGEGVRIDEWSQYNYQKSAGDDSVTTMGTAAGGHTGRCAIINSSGTNDARIYQSIDVAKNQIYLVTCMVKLENVPETGAGFNISAIDAGEHSESLYGTTDGWQSYSAYIKTGEDQTSVELAFCLGGYGAESSGVVYLDNVSIKPVKQAADGAGVVNVTKYQNTTDTSSVKKLNIWFKLLFASLCIGLLVYIILLAKKTDKENFAKRLPMSETNPRLDKTDYIILAVITLVTVFMSYYRLGDTKAASSYWKATSAGDCVIVEFENETKVSKSMYYNNIPIDRGSYSVSYEKTEGTGDYTKAFTISKGSFFEWSSNSSSFTTKRVKVEAVSSGLPVNELAFYTKSESGEYQLIPLKVVTVLYDETLGNNNTPDMLFDEQDCAVAYTTYMNSTYFDEIYFPRTAYENINGLTVYETTHPPLGKLFIALGIKIFGMDPFGWRFMGTFFGVLMVPLMYLFGLKLFKKRQYAFLAAFLIMFDFMRLAQTRLATIDSYSCFFVIAMYYFMYDYFTQKSYEKNLWKSFIPLLICGIMFGLGSASKWTSVYAGGGMAVLFFLAKYLESDDYSNSRFQIPAGKKNWVMGNFLPTCGVCVIFFILIPGLIYVLSYIPYMAPSPEMSLWDIVMENQESMYNYHSGLTEGHPYGSAWYTWLVDYRPIYYYSGSSAGNAADIRTSIVSMGNPAIWLAGLAAIFPSVYFAWKKRQKGMIAVFVGYAFQFFPWILVTRVAFIYHYFTAVPFLIFMLVYCIKCMFEDKIVSKTTVFIYMAIVLILFIMYYPVLTGQSVKTTYVDFLRVIDSWDF